MISRASYLARRNRMHLARVALVASSLVVGIYAVACVVLDVAVTHRLVTEIDARLFDRLEHVAKNPHASDRDDDSEQLDDAPALVWRVSRSGFATALEPTAPPLPRLRWVPGARTMEVGGVAFRLVAERTQGGYLVAGEAISQVARTRSALEAFEFLGGVLLWVAGFGGAFIVGLKASAPLEAVRRQQAEFSADASHELRTPLSVIEAELELALRRPRDEAHYEEVLRRVAAESSRLRRIVDDLLWLARMDSGRERTAEPEVVDLGALAQTTVERFRALAEQRGLRLQLELGAGGPHLVRAVPNWLERLAGVLVDNACKHAGEGATCWVYIGGSGNRVLLRVDDDGPGIPPDERQAVLNRFHRLSERTEGTGLGLAIADSAAKATGGLLRISESPHGGARFEVSWRRAGTRQPEGTATKRSPNQAALQVAVSRQENTELT
jgi:signal transduction histidine kinase